jgi:hypothetical protein
MMMCVPFSVINCVLFGLINCLLFSMISCASYITDYFRPGHLYNCEDLVVNDRFVWCLCVLPWVGGTGRIVRKERH